MSADWVAMLMLDRIASVKWSCSAYRASGTSAHGLSVRQSAKKSSTSTAVGVGPAADRREVIESRRISSGGVQGPPSRTACTPSEYPSMASLANVVGSMLRAYSCANGTTPAEKLSSQSKTVPMMSNVRAFTAMAAVPPTIVPAVSDDLDVVLHQRRLPGTASSRRTV